MLGRHAIAALCGRAQEIRPKLWLPSFFCFEVARACRRVAEIRYYRDDCRWPEPDWDTLRPGAQDLVLAVNYFGVRSPEPWLAWRQHHPCVFVEDHTQDPFSAWARTSSADFTVCSVRKTVPVPDGAVLYSPVGSPVPEAPTGGDWSGSDMKLGAMIYKRDYLNGTLPVEVKTRYRELQLAGEERMSASAVAAISPFAKAMLARGVPKIWRQRREENARVLLGLLNSWRDAQPVYTQWPEGHAPFDLPLVFGTQEERDCCQHIMQQNDIYCSVEWICDADDVNAIALSKTILSMPLDYRYDEQVMKRIATGLWSASPELAAVRSRISAGCL